MSYPTEDRLRESIDGQIENFEEAQEYAQIQRERGRYEGLGSDIGCARGNYRRCRDIGKRYAMLGDRENAVEWFGDAADHIIEALQLKLDNWEEIDPEGRSSSALDGYRTFLMALLALDDNRLDQAVELSSQMPETHAESYGFQAPTYHASCVLRHLVADSERDAVTDAVAHLDADKMSEIDTGLVTLAHGMLDGNPDHVADGIETQLEAHEEDVTEENGEISMSDWVALSGTSSYVLAQRKGFDVSVSSDFIPDIYHDI